MPLRAMTCGLRSNTLGDDVEEEIDRLPKEYAVESNAKDNRSAGSGTSIVNMGERAQFQSSKSRVLPAST